MKKILTAVPLTCEAFAPFGDVIELAGANHYPINLGSTERFHDLANVDTTDAGGRTLINLFRGQPRELPFEIKMMERHPLGSQAFIPLDDSPYLIVVALPGELSIENLRAFITVGWQGVNYAKNTWHHPLLAIGKVSDFIVIDRGGDGNNLIEKDLTESIMLVADPMP
jgi:ureidoglycolate lyase